MAPEEPHGFSFLGLGESLAEARLSRGLELRDVERDTRIRTRYLLALEQERFDDLPDDAYARVFLRTYAAYLGLDPDAYADEYRRRRGDRDETIAPAPPTTSPRQRLTILIAGAALVAAVGASLALTLGLRDGGSPARAPAPATAPDPSPAGPGRVATSVAVTARRGATSMVVRFDGPEGPKVWEGTLRHGRTIRFGLARPLWLSIAAPANVDVVRGDETIPPRRGLLLDGRS